MLGGRAEAGTNFNVTPDFYSFTIDRRINPEEDLEKKNAGARHAEVSKSRYFRGARSGDSGANPLG